MSYDEPRIMAYLLGLLSDAESEAIREAACTDAALHRKLEEGARSLDVEFAPVRRLLGSEFAELPVEPLPAAGVWHYRSFWAILSCALTVLLLGPLIAYGFWASWSKDKTLARLTTQNQGYQVTQSAIAPPGTPNGNASAIVPLSLVRGQIGSTVPTVGQATVTVRNVLFPCELKWKVGEQEGTENIDSAGKQFVIPNGKVRITIEPSRPRAYLQTFFLVHNQRELGSALGTVILDLQAGDQLGIHLDQVSPPWNAVMVPIKGEWVMVTIVKPWANRDVDAFLQGRYGNPEDKLPNTMLFWRQLGSEGMARKLAEHFVEARKQPSASGDYRNKLHAAMMVPLTDGKPAGALRTATVEDLIPPLTEAFELLKKQRPPQGRAVQEEFDLAAEVLKQFPKPQ
jgi:hypothetical protein